jgi:hypothetical protein
MKLIGNSVFCVKSKGRVLFEQNQQSYGKQDSGLNGNENRCPEEKEILVYTVAKQ